MLIRKRIFEFEDNLKSEFKIPFRAFTVPDDMDPNIPRFESESIHGHSRLQVSQSRVTLATNYNDEFKLDYDQVEHYIDNKCKLLSDLVESENVEFIAYIIELGVFMNPESINKFMKKHTGVIAISDDCIDFSLLYSMKHKEDYFINVKSSKFTQKELLLHQESKSLRPTGKEKFGISIVLDINTRPLFLKKMNFDNSLYESLKDEVFNVIKEKNVEQFLKGDL